MKRAASTQLRNRAPSTPGTAATPGQLAARANKWRDQFNPLRGISVQRAVSLCEAFNRGEMADLQWTYFAIEQADPDLFTICERRTSALTEMDFDISVVAGRKRRADFDETLAQEQQAALREAYDRLDNLYAAVAHLSSAVFRGFAHLEKQRDGGGDVTHLEIGDQWNMVRDGLRGAWKYNPEARACSFASLPESNRLDPDNFIIREVGRHVNHIALKKFVRTALGEKDWTAFLEIYGIPSGVVIMPPNIPTGKETEYETAAGRIAEGGNGALPNGSDYKANDAPRGIDPFNPFLRYFTEKLVMAGTGGLLTVLTQSGSGTLAGSAHTEAFKTLARGDARAVNEIFQRNFDKEIIEAAFPGKPVLAYFELAFNSEPSVTEIVDHAQKLSAAGYLVDAAELSEKTRYTITVKSLPPAPVFGNPIAAVSDRRNPDAAAADEAPTGEDTPADGGQRPPLQNRDGFVTIDGPVVFVGADKDETDGGDRGELKTLTSKDIKPGDKIMVKGSMWTDERHQGTVTHVTPAHIHYEGGADQHQVMTEHYARVVREKRMSQKQADSELANFKKNNRQFTTFKIKHDRVVGLTQNGKTYKADHWKDSEGKLYPIKNSAPLANRATLKDGLAELLGARSEWLAPVAQLFDSIEKAARNGELSDSDLLTAVEEAALRLPELFADMDVNALAGALETSMKDAAQKAAANSVSKP